jgi:hypothetical protein
MENPDGTVRLATEEEIDYYDKTQQVCILSEITLRKIDIFC